MGVSPLLSLSSPPLAFVHSFPQIWDAAVALCDVGGLTGRVVGSVEGTDGGVWIGTGPGLGKTLFSTMEMEQETLFCLSLSVCFH